jgi:GT2 family glycosyltransferase
METASVSGAALMIRRSAWDALGGFDQQIFLYWEDTDLCWRAWLSGMRVLYIPSALIYHERGGSGGGRAWSGEAAKHGLYVHLKLMRWRRAVPYLLRQIPASCLRVLRGQSGAFAIWWWNILNLRKTLAQRRTYLRQRQIDPAYLERLITIHDRTLRKRRWYTGGQ